jgi:hypothetical protein
MKKAKLSTTIILLAGLVILLGGSSDVFGRACTLPGGGGTLGSENPGAKGDDYGCFMVVDLQIADVTRLPDAHVSYEASGIPNRVEDGISGAAYLADYRVIMSYAMTCQGKKGGPHTFSGSVQDDSGGFIWWAFGDTCGPFATWFGNLLGTDVAAALGGQVVLKEQGQDNEDALAPHFDVTAPNEGLIPNTPLQYNVEFTITKLQ